MINQIEPSFREEENSKEYITKWKHEYYIRNREKILNRCKIYSQENKEKRKEYSSEYRKDNKEKIREQNKRYREKNIERDRQNSRDYHAKHRDEMNVYSRIYRTTNEEYLKKYFKEHYEENKISICEKRKNNPHIQNYMKSYRIYNRDIIRQQEKRYWLKNHDKRLFLTRRAKAKRNRQLGYEELNEFFEGSHGHHIDKTHVIYIPEELHGSISHSVLSSERNNNGLARLNEQVYVWLLTGKYIIEPKGEMI